MCTPTLMKIRKLVKKLSEGEDTLTGMRSWYHHKQCTFFHSPSPNETSRDYPERCSCCPNVKNSPPCWYWWWQEIEEYRDGKVSNGKIFISNFRRLCLFMLVTLMSVRDQGTDGQKHAAR